jgi:hypothetical protein
LTFLQRSTGFLFLLCTLALGQLQNIDYAVVAASTFQDKQNLQLAEQWAVLAKPTTRNQFVVLETAGTNALHEVTFSMADGVTDNIKVLVGMSPITFQQAKVRTIVQGEQVILTLEQPLSGQYVKIQFGQDVREIPLRIRNIKLFAKSETSTANNFKNIQIITSANNTAIITYETEFPVQTNVVYGTNFDFLYESKLEQAVLEPTPKIQHSVVLSGLLPKVTYAACLVLKDAQGQEQRSAIQHFTVIPK